MNDDLYLIIETINGDLLKSEFFAKIPHGMNTFPEWKYYRETEILEQYENMFSLSLNGATIIDVRSITGECEAQCAPD